MLSGPRETILRSRRLRKEMSLPDEDEIVKGVRLTQDGRVVNERLLGA